MAACSVCLLSGGQLYFNISAHFGDFVVLPPDLGILRGSILVMFDHTTMHLYSVVRSFEEIADVSSSSRHRSCKASFREGCRLVMLSYYHSR